MALGISKNDIVWTSPITFVASSNCALYCDAIIDFVDIDPLTNFLDVDLLESKLIRSSSNGTLPKSSYLYTLLALVAI